jgi:hypothetical protein
MSDLANNQLIAGGTARLAQFLHTWTGLAALCSQNGWIDNDSLELEVIEAQDDALVINVQFEEIIMEGAGCIADRVSCFGRVAIETDGSGQVIRAWIL